MYFPVSGVEVSPFYPPFFAFIISTLCSMTGISGAFLLLPYQVSVLGYVQPGVSATNQIFNLLACPAGVLRYAREGRLLLPLALFIAAGTLPGVFIGALVRLAWLARPRYFVIFVAIVLIYLGYRLLAAPAGNNSRSRASGPVSDHCRVLVCSWRGLRFSYGSEEYQVPGMGLFCLSLAVGVVGGIYGVGGGAIMVPFLVSFFRLPIHAIAGASLLATFLTSIFGVGFYSLLAHIRHLPWAAPDWALGALLGLGGLVGAWCGASLQKYVPAKILRVFLALIVILMACRYIYQALTG